MKIPRARAQMNKINGIQSNYQIYKNEGNPYSQQEVI